MEDELTDGKVSQLLQLIDFQQQRINKLRDDLVLTQQRLMQVVEMIGKLWDALNGDGERTMEMLAVMKRMAGGTNRLEMRLVALEEVVYGAVGQKDAAKEANESGKYTDIAARD